MRPRRAHRFTPARLAGKALWLRPTEWGYADGAPVTIALDKAVGGDLFPVSDDARPTFKRDIRNGRSAIRFDGGDLVGRLSALPSGTCGSVYAAYSVPSPTSNQVLLSGGDESSDARYIAAMVSAADPVGAMAIIQASADAQDTVITPAATTPAATWVVGEWHSDGSAYEIRKNGVVQPLTVGGENSGDWFGDTAGLDNLVVGGFLTQSGLGQPVACDLAELVLFDGVVHATTEKQRMRAYLGLEVGTPVYG